MRSNMHPKSVSRSLVCAALACATFGQSHAATPPSASGSSGGTIEGQRETQHSYQPAVTPSDNSPWFAPPKVASIATSTVTFPLKTVKIQGISVLSREKVEALISPYRGRDVSLSQLQGVADAITKLYSDAGYGLSFAVVPEQDVQDGVVRIVAVEVLIDRVSVEMSQKSASLVAPKRIQDFLARRADSLRQERPVKVAHLEQILLSLNDMPGVKATGTIQQGTRGQGAARLLLTIEVTGATASLAVDNRLRPEFGRYEYALEGAFRSLLVVGDELTVDVARSTAGDDFAYRSARYEAPLFGSRNTGFMSVSNADTKASRGGLAAVQFRGAEQGYHFGVTAPLVRTRSQKLSLQVEFAAIDSETRMLGATVVRNRTRTIDAGLDYNFADRFMGVNQASVSFEQGISGLGASRHNASLSKPDNVLISPLDATPQYLLTRARIGRNQSVLGFDAAFNIDAQGVLYGLLPAPANCAFGGATMGRAYNVSPLTGDECVRASLQVSRQMVFNHNIRVAPFLFGDAGQIWRLGAAPVGDTNYARAQSIGFGFDIALIQGWSLNSVAAYPVGASTTNITSPSAYFTLNYRR